MSNLHPYWRSYSVADLIWLHMSITDVSNITSLCVGIKLKDTFLKVRNNVYSHKGSSPKCTCNILHRYYYAKQIAKTIHPGRRAYHQICMLCYDLVRCFIYEMMALTSKCLVGSKAFVKRKGQIIMMLLVISRGAFRLIQYI